MNNALRRISFFVGIGLLAVSMYWSADGFNFDMAGDSGYKTLAVVIAWFLAVATTVMEFVFSSEFKELNASLILFGVLAYAYSIYTNYGGVVHFQGISQNQLGAVILAIIMDAVPEPLIAWGLYESQAGDFVGNLIKSVVSAPGKIQEQNKVNYQPVRQFNEKTPEFHGFSPELVQKLEKNGKNIKKQPNFSNSHILHRINEEKPNRFQL